MKFRNAFFLICFALLVCFFLNKYQWSPETQVRQGLKKELLSSSKLQSTLSASPSVVVSSRELEEFSKQEFENKEVDINGASDQAFQDQELLKSRDGDEFYHADYIIDESGMESDEINQQMSALQRESVVDDDEFDEGEEIFYQIMEQLAADGMNMEILGNDLARIDFTGLTDEQLAQEVLAVFPYDARDILQEMLDSGEMPFAPIKSFVEEAQQIYKIYMQNDYSEQARKPFNPPFREESDRVDDGY